MITFDHKFDLYNPANTITRGVVEFMASAGSVDLYFKLQLDVSENAARCLKDQVELKQPTNISTNINQPYI